MYRKKQMKSQSLAMVWLQRKQPTYLGSNVSKTAFSNSLTKAVEPEY